MFKFFQNLIVGEGGHLDYWGVEARTDPKGFENTALGPRE